MVGGVADESFDVGGVAEDQFDARIFFAARVVAHVPVGQAAAGDRSFRVVDPVLVYGHCDQCDSLRVELRGEAWPFERGCVMRPDRVDDVRFDWLPVLLVSWFRGRGDGFGGVE